MATPLDGTINTPIGAVKKKTALIIGGGVVVLGAIIWYRQKKLGGGSSAVNPDDAPINPATGYPYGSPEDAAALQSQSAYVSPTIPTGGGSNVPPSNVGYSSNGQWTQATVEYMTSGGLVSDPTQLSAALGKYITGAYADESAVSLIQQAIAANGFPPISGTNGYPPSINRNPPTSTNPPPTTTPETRKPKPSGPRGYGWIQATKAGESIQSLANRSGTPLDNFTKYNSADKLNRVEKGEWFRTRYDSNPTSGYTGR